MPPFEHLQLDLPFLIMSLLKIDEDSQEKKNLPKSLHCWFNLATVNLWVVMSLSSYYSSVLLVSSFKGQAKVPWRARDQISCKCIQESWRSRKLSGSLVCFHQILRVVGTWRKTCCHSLLVLLVFQVLSRTRMQSHSIINKWSHGNGAETCKKGLRVIRNFSRNICLCFPGWLMPR